MSASEPNPALRRLHELSAAAQTAGPEADRVDWGRVVPYLAMHAAVPLVFLVGWSPVAVWTAVGLYLLRMFAVTGFYHRYFSHRAFETSRAAQFVFAFLGTTAVQRGPLWWAAHHRLHHRHSDQEEDTHSPTRHGFLHSHTGWFLNKRNYATRVEQVPDLARYPELRWLDRWDIVGALFLAFAVWGVGAWLETAAPGLGTDRWQMLVWGFVISTVVLYHATFTINSLAHTWGKRRYETKDTSRNNLFLALLTLGEGWHNNHHRHPGAVRQGFRWYELDLTWYLLLGMEKLRLVRKLRPVPERVLEEGRR